MIRALIIPVDGPLQLTEYDGSLEQLQAMVGGYFTNAKFCDVANLVCDEEGGPKGLPVNKVATLLYRMYGGFMLEPDANLVGQVAILGPIDNANYTSLALPLAEDLMGKARHIQRRIHGN